MTDLDKLRLCAEAAERTALSPDCGGWLVDDGGLTVYNPLENSDQALELLCWLVRHRGAPLIHHDQFETHYISTHGDMTSPAALRRAIVDAVVKVKEGK